MNVPVFDKSVDYSKRVSNQMNVLEKVQSLYEDHSVDYLSMLKDVMDTQTRLNEKIKEHEILIVQRRREEKQARKDYKKMMKLAAKQKRKEQK